MMADNRPCRRDLLHWINVVSFALNDTPSCLGHPSGGDREALAFFDDVPGEEKPCAEGVCQILRPSHDRYGGCLGDRQVELDQ